MSVYRHKISSFWLCYFFIRLFYLLFATQIFARLTTLGDTEWYLAGGQRPFSLMTFHNSTYFMHFFGGVIGAIFRRNLLLSSIPAMLISFFITKWVIEKLELRKRVNNVFLMAMISLPNFSIWTSVWSKEVFGLVFSSIIVVTIINFLNGKYEIKIIDIVGMYICLVFKPQYLPFILQGLIFIYIAREYMNRKTIEQVILGLTILLTNILFLYIIRDTVNMYAGRMHGYFVFYGAGTRENIFLEDYDFFRHLPRGMFVAFFGPTLGEMRDSPLHVIAGIESLSIIFLFLYLLKYTYADGFFNFRFSPVVTISYLIIFIGICFIHYPFGIFNPGAAIRYRTNFIFLFIVLLLYLYGQRQKYYLIGKKLRLRTQKG